MSHYLGQMQPYGERLDYAPERPTDRKLNGGVLGEDSFRMLRFPSSRPGCTSLSAIRRLRHGIDLISITPILRTIICSLVKPLRGEMVELRVDRAWKCIQEPHFRSRGGDFMRAV